ncbi:MAG TPA: metallophosphoesterase, partial [candidate division Zixibacteria bacterium]|nr:metallophosphoesterase [candidate division Zixibacteria bacterium]
MPKCFFVSDLHGSPEKYRQLFLAVEGEQPDAVFLGGDLLPHAMSAHSGINPGHRDFINDFLVRRFSELRDKAPRFYPRVFLIFGNDDARFEEAAVLDAAANEIWEYVSERKVSFGKYEVFGYPFSPPSPFQLKDWERYDVSRFVDPGSVSPEEGVRTKTVSDYQKRFTTIRQDLSELINGDDLSNAIMLFHAPPYKTNLDRAELDGKSVDYAPLDVHVG